MLWVREVKLMMIVYTPPGGLAVNAISTASRHPNTKQRKPYQSKKRNKP